VLGQQELEGRRVPRMSSGKTLPCFGEYDAGVCVCLPGGYKLLLSSRNTTYFGEYDAGVCVYVCVCVCDWWFESTYVLRKDTAVWGVIQVLLIGSCRALQDIPWKDAVKD
jgi:hypothetical protein